MEVKLNQAKDTITITLPYNNSASAPISTSGKSMKRASTAGNIGVNLDGKIVQVGVNAFEKLPG